MFYIALGRSKATILWCRTRVAPASFSIEPSHGEVPTIVDPLEDAYKPASDKSGLLL